VLREEQNRRNPAAQSHGSKTAPHGAVMIARLPKKQNRRKTATQSQGI